MNERMRIRSHEADISAEPNQAPSNPWVPGTDEDQGRASGVERPPGQGPKAARGQRFFQIGVTRALNGTGGSVADGESEGAADGEDKLGSRQFQRSDRLLDSRDFTRVLRRGRRRSSAELVVVTSESPKEIRGRDQVAFAGPPMSRLGITVGRKAGPSVKRNLFKRRVREWFRHHREELPDPLDIVVIARRPGVDLSLAELAIRLSGLLGLKRTQSLEKDQDSHLI